MKKWQSVACHQWVDSISGILEVSKKELPGGLCGLPERSIYDYLDEDVAVPLERRAAPRAGDGMQVWRPYGGARFTRERSRQMST